jgi:hypothetical protein
MNKHSHSYNVHVLHYHRPSSAQTRYASRYPEQSKGTIFRPQECQGWTVNPSRCPSTSVLILSIHPSRSFHPRTHSWTPTQSSTQIQFVTSLPLMLAGATTALHSFPRLPQAVPCCRNKKSKVRPRHENKQHTQRHRHCRADSNSHGCPFKE